MNCVFGIFFMSLAFEVLSQCFEDNVEAINVAKVYVNYNSRYKRSLDKSIHYSPMRFHTTFENSATRDQEQLRLLVDKATSRVSQLFSVIPVDGSLLLERTSCGSIWSHGLNRGRCSSIRPHVPAEFCGNKVDGFLIPDGHLDGLEVFNFTGRSPVWSVSPGQGVQADYLLYVRTVFSQWCQKSDVVAYASYCRLDQYNRPIAGFIDFCTFGLKDRLKNEDNFMNVVIHELFHALGFSKNLFPEFRGCSPDDQDGLCKNIKNLVVDASEVFRLNLPTVVQNMKTHFSCDEDEFGAPLEKVNSSYSSHWDQLLLHGSIMAPDINNLDEALIDPITLAVFADSGWYKVNFSAADKYTWGKGQGCNFGLTGDCSNSPYLCDFRNQTFGCSFSRQAQMKCEPVHSRHKCGVWKPSKSCRSEDITYQGEHYHHLQCALMENQQKIETICTAYSCESHSVVSFLIDERWISCSSGNIVTIGDKKVICPSEVDFCSKNFTDLDVHSGLQSSSATRIVLSYILLILAIFIGQTCWFSLLYNK